MTNSCFNYLIGIMLISSQVRVVSSEWQTFKVLQTLPHDTEAFTQGLVFHDNTFIEGTGQFGRSSLRVVEPRTGKVKKKSNFPPSFLVKVSL